MVTEHFLAPVFRDLGKMSARDDLSRVQLGRREDSAEGRVVSWALVAMCYCNLLLNSSSFHDMGTDILYNKACLEEVMNSEILTF